MLPPALEKPLGDARAHQPLTWQDCDINAEDCRIKAVLQPSLREKYLNEARWWDALAARLDV